MDTIERLSPQKHDTVRMHTYKMRKEMSDKQRVSFLGTNEGGSTTGSFSCVCIFVCSICAPSRFQRSRRMEAAVMAACDTHLPAGVTSTSRRFREPSGGRDGSERLIAFAT